MPQGKAGSNEAKKNRKTAKKSGIAHSCANRFPFSLIRTMTVGFGVTPNLLTRKNNQSYIIGARGL